MKNEKNYMDFLMIKIWQIFNRFGRSFHQAKTSYYWKMQYIYKYYNITLLPASWLTLKVVKLFPDWLKVTKYSLSWNWVKVKAAWGVSSTPIWISKSLTCCKTFKVIPFLSCMTWESLVKVATKWWFASLEAVEAMAWRPPPQPSEDSGLKASFKVCLTSFSLGAVVLPII